jgi:(p)ppGpp synthase/HD superfamily hydrolase
LTRDGLFLPSQTNTALYLQLHEEGYRAEDIARVQKAYYLCCLMFNGRYRKTGRPFVCHAVGAASSAAHFEKNVDYVLAAMFLAAYDSGQYPDGKSSRRTEAHRLWLQERIGSAAEQLAGRLAKLTFEKGEPERLADMDIAPGDEDILFLVLAHEVDDLADGGLAFAPKYGASIETRVKACALLARRLGRENLAATIEAYGKRYEAMGWISALQEPRPEGFRVAPNLRQYIKLRRANLRGESVEVL